MAVSNYVDKTMQPTLILVKPWSDSVEVSCVTAFVSSIDGISTKIRQLQQPGTFRRGKVWNIR